MNLRQLRTFIVIADAGGLARAEGRLHLSQPAACRQIQALETELGVPLFNRVGRRMQLTSEGEDLLRLSRRLLQDADSIGERARALKSGQTGILRVGATPQMIDNALAVFLTAYRRRHPGVEVHLLEEGAVRLPDRLNHGHIHLAVIPHNERFQYRTIYPVCVLAVLSVNHPLSRRRTLDVGRVGERATAAAHHLWLAAMVRCRLSDCAHSPARAVGERSPSHDHCIGPRRPWDRRDSSSALVPCEGVRTAPVVQRAAVIGRWMTMAWDPQRFPRPLCRAIHRGAGRSHSQELSRSRVTRTRPAPAAP